MRQRPSPGRDGAAIEPTADELEQIGHGDDSDDTAGADYDNTAYRAAGPLPIEKAGGPGAACWV